MQRISYAGIGSRETPDIVQEWMRDIARALYTRGYLVRSGNARGADKAFGNVVPEEGRRVYLPFSGFEGGCPGSVIPSQWDNWPEALRIAQSVHPYWDRLKPGDHRYMGRNTYQVLGDDLQSPSAFILLWAPKPRLEHGRVMDVEGGTGQAVRLAASCGISRYHLGIGEHRVKIGQVLGLDLPLVHPQADVRPVQPRRARP